MYVCPNCCQNNGFGGNGIWAILIVIIIIFLLCPGFGFRGNNC